MNKNEVKNSIVILRNKILSVFVLQKKKKKKSHCFGMTEQINTDNINLLKKMSLIFFKDKKIFTFYF